MGLLWVMPAFAEDSVFFKVREVLNGKSFVLETGETVRLASIEAPNVREKDSSLRRGRPGEPLGEEAAAALSALVKGKKIRIEFNPGKRDRHNRLLGQAFDEEGRWIQGEMLKQGWAMVYSFSDDRHDVIERMLAAERQARKAGRGIWADAYYKVISCDDAGAFVNRFKLVEGRVASVNESHGNLYVNFYKDWKGKFYLFISRKNREAFTSMHVNDWVGKNVRVRGWIDYHHAPSMSITHPEQMEWE